MIDVNNYVSRWPFRRLPNDQTERMIRNFDELGIEKAWTCSLDTLFHRDVAAVNERLVKECHEMGGERFIPFGAINPTVPDWQEDLRRCVEDYEMSGIRLHPNYHGYELSDEIFGSLMERCSELRLIVQIAIIMEDERTQRIEVPAVDPHPIIEVSKRFDEIPFVLLNAMRTLSGRLVEPFAECENVYFDIANLEGLGGLDRLIQRIPIERILFGTYSPVFIAESAAGKLQESEIGGAIREQIVTSNADNLLARLSH